MDPRHISRPAELSKNWFSRATKTWDWKRCVEDASHASVLGQDGDELVDVDYRPLPVRMSWMIFSSSLDF